MNTKRVLWVTEKFLDHAEKLRDLGTEIYVPDFLLKEIKKKDLFIPLSSIGLDYPSDFLDISIIKRFDLFVVDVPEQKPIWNEDELLKKIEMSFSLLIKLAVKNYRDAVVAVDEETLEIVIDDIKECGDIPLQERRKLSLKAILKLIIYYADLHKFLSETFASEKFHYMLLDKIQSLKYGENLHQEAELLKLYSHHSFFEDLEFVNLGLPSVDELVDLYEGMLIAEKLCKNSCVLTSYGSVRCIANFEGLETNIEKIIKYKKHFEVSGLLIVKGEVDSFLLEKLRNARIRTVAAENFIINEMNRSIKMIKIKKFQPDECRYIYRFLGSTAIRYELNKYPVENRLTRVNNIKEKPEDKENLIFISSILKELKSSSAILAEGKKILYLSTGCSSTYEAINNVLGQFEKFQENLKEEDRLILATDTILKNNRLLDKIKESGVKVFYSFGNYEDEKLIKGFEDNGIVLFQSDVRYFKY